MIFFIYFHLFTSITILKIQYTYELIRLILLMIKFLNIFRQDKNIFNDNIKDIAEVIKKSEFINGTSVKVFEKNFLNSVKLNILLVAIVGPMLFFLL